MGLKLGVGPALGTGELEAVEFEGGIGLPSLAGRAVVGALRDSVPDQAPGVCDQAPFDDWLFAAGALFVGFGPGTARLAEVGGFVEPNVEETVVGAFLGNPVSGSGR